MLNVVMLSVVTPSTPCLQIIEEDGSECRLKNTLAYCSANLIFAIRCLIEQASELAEEKLIGHIFINLAKKTYFEVIRKKEKFSKSIS